MNTILLANNYMLTQYLDTNMVPTNTIGFTVTVMDHMCFCICGLGFLDPNLTSNCYSMAKWPQPMAVDEQVVHRGDLKQC